MKKNLLSSYNERRIRGNLWINYGYDLRGLRLGFYIHRRDFCIDIWPFHLGAEWYGVPDISEWYNNTALGEAWERVNNQPQE